jgi:hypothetical protein
MEPLATAVLMGAITAVSIVAVWRLLFVSAQYADDPVWVRWAWLLVWVALFVAGSLWAVVRSY